MRIWVDILTPKEVHFFEPMIKRLEKKRHVVLATTRTYGEVTGLPMRHAMNLEIFGRHGGKDKAAKLKAGIYRMEKLRRRITDFKPDVVISFCSPEAARISFGLGIRHIAFNDSPHHKAAMRLTLPLVWKLLSPWFIPTREFTKYGINPKDVIHYKAVDAAFTVRHKTDSVAPLPFRKSNAPNILIRPDEEQAAYVERTGMAVPVVKRMVAEFGDSCNVVILARYQDQARSLRDAIKGSPNKARVVLMRYDGRHLLDNTDVFVGSGGTMAAEAALLGVPTISYGAVPHIIESFLVKRGFIRIEMDPGKIVSRVRRILQSDNSKFRKKAAEFVANMEDPADKLIALLDNKTK